MDAESVHVILTDCTVAVCRRFNSGVELLLEAHTNASGSGVGLVLSGAGCLLERLELRRNKAITGKDVLRALIHFEPGRSIHWEKDHSSS